MVKRLLSQGKRPDAVVRLLGVALVEREVGLEAMVAAGLTPQTRSRYRRELKGARIRPEDLKLG